MSTHVPVSFIPNPMSFIFSMGSIFAYVVDLPDFIEYFVFNM